MSRKEVIVFSLGGGGLSKSSHGGSSPGGRRPWVRRSSPGGRRPGSSPRVVAWGRRLVVVAEVVALLVALVVARGRRLARRFGRRPRSSPGPRARIVALGCSILGGRRVALDRRQAPSSELESTSPGAKLRKCTCYVKKYLFFSLEVEGSQIRAMEGRRAGRRITCTLAPAGVGQD